MLWKKFQMLKNKVSTLCSFTKYKIRRISHPNRWSIDLLPNGKEMGSMLNPNRVIAKGIKSCTYCLYVRCATLIVRVRGMPWHQTRATHYHADLGLPDKSRAIKGLVVCYVVWLVSIKGMGLRTCARCVQDWSLVVVRMAIELKYHNKSF